MAAILDCHKNSHHVDTVPSVSTLYYEDSTIYEVKNNLKKTFAIKKKFLQLN